MSKTVMQPLEVVEYPDALLTMATVKALLGMSRQSIYKMVQHEEFPAPVKFGRLNRWRADEVQRWLKAKGGKPPS